MWSVFRILSSLKILQGVPYHLNDMGLSRLDFEHPTFRLRDERSNPLRHRRGQNTKAWQKTILYFHFWFVRRLIRIWQRKFDTFYQINSSFSSWLFEPPTINCVTLHNSFPIGSKNSMKTKIFANGTRLKLLKYASFCKIVYMY